MFLETAISDLKKLSGKKIKIYLINNQQSEISLKLKDFTLFLKEHLPDIKIKIKKEILPAYPAIKLTDEKEKIQIYYMAIPEGGEWLPFLKALEAITIGKSFLNQKELERIKNIKKPIEIKVFITPICPFCPLVVEKANQLAIAHSSIKTFVIDSNFYSDLAKQYKVTASPTVVINKDYFLVGTDAREKLIDFLEKANQIMYDAEVLKSLLKQAQADRVIELCQKDEKYLYNLLSLLKAPELFTRIGVMRVLEELAEKREIKEKILPSIIAMLDTKEERDKGDILFLLGLIGNLEVVPIIQKIAENASPLIKEIALEAIEQIKERETLH